MTLKQVKIIKSLGYDINEEEVKVYGKNSGISYKLAQILVVGGPILGCILLAFASMQLYRGIKSKDLFI